MHILLLGGSGLLGSALQRHWTEHHLSVPSHAELDASDADACARIIDRLHPDLVVNLVAYNNVDKAEGEGKNDATTLNVHVPAFLARLTGERQLPFFHFSSDYVFDGTRPEGYTEADTPLPINAYGHSKAAGEKEALQHNPLTYIIRTSRLYGPRPSSPNAKRSFVDLILRDAEQSTAFLVNQAEVASPTYVDDLAMHLRTHLLSLPNPGIYHIANQGGATWFVWAEAIIRELRLPVSVNRRDPKSLHRPALRPAYSILLSQKIPAMRDWREALHDFLTHTPPSFHPVWQPSTSSQLPSTTSP